MIPETYQEWWQFTAKDCGITLTDAYIEERLSVLQNPRDIMTVRFRETYGQQQLEQTIGWFEQARGEKAFS